jgi:hypothetical protein
VATRRACACPLPLVCSDPPSANTFIMTRNSFTLQRAVPALLLAAALVAPPVHAEQSNVPFKALVATYEELTIDPTRCPVFAGKTIGRGAASDNGAFVMTATDCVTPNPANGTFTFSNGVFTFTFADGDRMKAAYAGTLSPTGPNTPVYKLDGSYTVDGGTGRFRRATGGGVLQGTLVLGGTQEKPTASGTISAVGRISY